MFIYIHIFIDCFSILKMALFYLFNELFPSQGLVISYQAAQWGWMCVSWRALTRGDAWLCKCTGLHPTQRPSQSSAERTAGSSRCPERTMETHENMGGWSQQKASVFPCAVIPMNAHTSTQVNNPDNAFIPRRMMQQQHILLTKHIMRWQGSRMSCWHKNSSTIMRWSSTWEEKKNNRPNTRIGRQTSVEEGVQKKKRHYTMQMIWLLGAAPPAKKVHFNLNGSELRGFPIKDRSGQSSILYANPLASKAVARFCLCPAVITGGQCAHGGCLSTRPFWCHFLPYIHSCHAYSEHTHTKHPISSVLEFP